MVISSSFLVEQRLHHQHILDADFQTPGEVVRWMGAVQAQDYLGSLWAIGQRMKRGTEADVENAIVNKTIVRSWPMRNTLHFIAARDIRWMLSLLAPRMITQRSLHYKQVELDKSVFSKCRKLIIRELEGGHRRTRDELYQLLERAKIQTKDQRGLHILAHLSQEGLLCFASRKNKQHTFALLEEWLPPSYILEHDQALAELALRYFNSHGPATVQDFTWWSGLTASDAKAGLEMVKSRLRQYSLNHNNYWMAEGRHRVKPVSSSVFLLPAWDEYTVGYKDRSDILDASHRQQAKNGIFNPVVVVSGRITGTWKRVIGRDKVSVEVTAFDAKTWATMQEIKVDRYSKFLEMPVSVNTKSLKKIKKSN